jgi:hypothetical protein
VVEQRYQSSGFIINTTGFRFWIGTPVFCYTDGFGFFGLLSDILQIGQRSARPEVNHEVGRLAILIDSEVVDGD